MKQRRSIAYSCNPKNDSKDKNISRDSNVNVMHHYNCYLCMLIPDRGTA